MSEEKEPLIFILAKTQTRSQIEDSIIFGTKMMMEKSHLIEGVKVPIKGWENTAKHPSQIKAAKKRYAEAIEWGLLGFLVSHNFESYAQEVYCMAYAKSKILGKDKMRFRGVDPNHMEETTKRSITAYLTLVENNL